MQRQAGYIGTMAAQGVGGQIGQIDYAASAPGSKWKAINTVNERDIARIRSRGGFNKSPRVLAANGSSQAFVTGVPDLGIGTFDVTRREYYAMGPECFFTVWQNSTSIVRLVASPINMRFYSSAKQAGPILRSFGTSGGTIIGLSYANGEINVLTGGAIYAQRGDTFEPAATSSAPINNGPVTSYAATGLTSAYTQLCHALGTYVAWSSINGAPTATTVMRYSQNNRSTFTLCTQPGLNTDASANGGTISWALYDPVQATFIAVSVYGEILISSDGITWTKSYVRTSGSATHGLVEFCVTKDGRLLAVGTGAGAGQYFEAASPSGPWSLVTVAISGKTFSTRAKGVAYAAGVRVLGFDADGTVNNEVCTAYSLDEGVNYKVLTQGGDGSMGTVAAATGRVMAAAGVAVTCKSLSSSDYLALQRLATDYSQQVALAVHDDMFAQPAGVGAKLNAYMRIV